MLHRKDRRLLLTLDTASGSLTWVTAVSFIVSGLAAARSHDQGHRRPPLSLPHSSDTACNSVRRLTVLYPSLELSFQALKSKTDVSEQSFHLLHGKGQGRDEAEPSAEGRGLFPQKRCHVGQKGGNRNGASPRDSLGCPQQAETRPQRPKPRAPTQCCPGEDTRPSQGRPGGPRMGRAEGAHTVISCQHWATGMLLNRNSCISEGEPWVLRRGFLSFTLRMPYCSFLPKVEKEPRVCVHMYVYTYTYIYSYILKCIMDIGYWIYIIYVIYVIYRTQYVLYLYTICAHIHTCVYVCVLSSSQFAFLFMARKIMNLLFFNRQ